MTEHRRVAAILVLTMISTGCSSQYWSSPATCALAGLGVGTAAGIGYAVSQTDDDATDWALGIGVGAVGGTLLGYGVCAILGREPGYSAATPAVRTAAAAEPELSPQAEHAIYGLGQPEDCAERTASSTDP